MTKQYQIKVTLLAVDAGHQDTDDYDPQSTYGDENVADFMQRQVDATNTINLQPHYSVYSRNPDNTWSWIADFKVWDEVVSYLSDRAGRQLNLHPQWTQDITV